MAKNKILIIMEGGMIRNVLTTLEDVAVASVDYKTLNETETTEGVTIEVDGRFNGNWTDTIAGDDLSDIEKEAKKTLAELDEQYPYEAPGYKSCYGVSIEDILSEAVSKGWIISDETAVEAMKLYDKRYIWDGGGLHGAPLIDYVLNELAEELGEETATHVSVWDEDRCKIKRKCTFNKVSNIISWIKQSDIQGQETFEGEYVELSDGSIINKFYNKAENEFVGLTEDEEAEYRQYIY